MNPLLRTQITAQIAAAMALFFIFIRSASAAGTSLSDYLTDASAAVGSSKLLGYGLDPWDPTANKSQIASDAWLTKVQQNPSTTVRFYSFLSHHANTEQYAKSAFLDINAHASILSANFNAAYTSSTSSSGTTTSQDDLVIVQAWAIHNIQTLSGNGRGLSDAAISAKHDTSTWLQNFGSAIVDRVYLGASVECTIHIQALDAASQSMVSEAVDAAASGMWGGANFTESWSDEEKKALHNTTVIVTFAATWNATHHPPPSLSGLSGRGDEVFKSFASLAKGLFDYVNNPDNATRVGYGWSPVSTLAGLGVRVKTPPEPTQIELATREKLLQTYYEAWQSLEKCKERCDAYADAITNPTDAADIKIFNAGSALCGSVQAKLLTGYLAWNKYPFDSEAAAKISYASLLTAKDIGEAGTQLGLPQSGLVDLRFINEAPNLHEARNRHPLSLRIWLQSVSGKAGAYGSDQWLPSDTAMKFGLVVTSDSGPLGSLISFGPSLQRAGDGKNITYQLGSSQQFDLPNDWTFLNIQPTYFGDLPQAGNRQYVEGEPTHILRVEVTKYLDVERDLQPVGVFFKVIGYKDSGAQDPNTQGSIAPATYRVRMQAY